jgi:hypothetical protein
MRQFPGDDPDIQPSSPRRVHNLGDPTSVFGVEDLRVPGLEPIYDILKAMGAIPCQSFPDPGNDLRIEHQR